MSSGMPGAEECAASDIDTGADGSWVGGVDGNKTCFFFDVAKGVFSQVSFGAISMISHLLDHTTRSRGHRFRSFSSNKKKKVFCGWA